MTAATALQAALAAVAAQDGVDGCALVDLATGMVLQWVGPPDHLPVAEAASDYWRLCDRQKAFAVLGAPRAQVIIHAHKRVTIVRCGEGLLLVTVSDENVAVDWARWKRSTGELHALAGAL